MSMISQKWQEQAGHHESFEHMSTGSLQDLNHRPVLLSNAIKK